MTIIMNGGVILLFSIFLISGTESSNGTESNSTRRNDSNNTTAIDGNNTTAIDGNNTTAIDGNNTTAIDGNKTTTEWFLYNAWGSFEPPTGVAVGEVARLTCKFHFVKQSTDRNIEFSLILGNARTTNIQWSENTFVNPGYDRGNRTITRNRTIESIDNGTELACKISSPKFAMTSSRPLMFRSPTTSVNIDYKTTKIDNTCCNTYDVLNCSANGYPYPTITWKDENGYSIPSYSVNGYSSVKVNKVGTYRWSCSASNQFSSEPVSTNIVIRNGGTANGVEFSIPKRFHVLSFLYIGLMLLIIG